MTPTPAELSARASAIKSRIHALNSDINAKAGPALNGGGPELLAEVKQAQAERRELADELELLEAAARSPEVQLAGLEARLNDQFASRLAGMRRNLCVVLSDKWAWLASQGDDDHRRAAVAELRDPGHVGLEPPRRISLSDLPRAFAAQLTRETEARAELAQFEQFAGNIAASQASEEHKAKPARLRLTVEVRTRHTEELLAATDLPPMPPTLERFL